MYAHCSFKAQCYCTLNCVNVTFLCTEKPRKVNCDNCFVVVVWNWIYNILMLTPDKNSTKEKKRLKTRIPHERKCKHFKQPANRIQQYIGKPTSKGHILYDSTYIIFSEWQNYRDGEQISGFQGFRDVVIVVCEGVWLWSGECGGDFCGSGIILYFNRGDGYTYPHMW